MGKEKEENEGAKHRRNAGATCEAILMAARTLFTQQGYTRVGVRDIAAAAGVDPALVSRYFGSKAGLFGEAVTKDFDISRLLSGERADFGKRLASYILSKEMAQQEADPLLALLRSTSQTQTPLQIIINQQFVEPLAQWLGGENSELRANLITSYLLGLVLTRNNLFKKSFSEAELQYLTDLVAPVLQFYVDSAWTQVVNQ